MSGAAISPNERGQGSGAWEVRRGRIGPERSRLLGPITGAGPGCRRQGARFREARWKPRHCLAGEFQAPLWAPVWTAHRWTSPVSLSPTCPQQQVLHPRQDGFLTCQEKSPSLQALFHLPRLHCVLLSYSSISPKLAGRGGWCPEPGVQLRAGSATALRDQSERSVRERCTSGETLAPGGSQLGREHRGVGPRGWEVGPGSPPHTARTPRTGCGFPAGCAQSLFPARLPRVRCTSGKESKCTIRGTPGARSQQGPAAASSCGWWASTGRWTSVRGQVAAGAGRRWGRSSAWEARRGREGGAGGAPGGQRGSEGRFGAERRCPARMDAADRRPRGTVPAPPGGLRCPLGSVPRARLAQAHRLPSPRLPTRVCAPSGPAGV